MSTPLSRPKFFISATSGDLEQFRTGVADHLGRCGFAKDDGAVPRPYPTRMRDGKRMQEAIEAADVVICLIGYDYGQALPEEDLPPDVPNGYSWTQWEWWHAKNIAQQGQQASMGLFLRERYGARPGRTSVSEGSGRTSKRAVPPISRIPSITRSRICTLCNSTWTNWSREISRTTAGWRRAPRTGKHR